MRNRPRIAGLVRPVRDRRTKPGRFAALRGTRKTRMSTDEIMALLRGYDSEARDPEFRAGKK